ncbi:hypothetical protein GGS23DRAFT_569373 [Durotheca rogersii]|uniref:uncharacterized protein n=1 Tax=Durotheca rogersii TaxID=419775 RepID=UPI00221FA5CF|nr:uncharacterized protein GGS23DRAFT_569373 [Durotheca rogersii]KAI5862776.1 hypothetical protein GGS23DRAFT_569373 [Durotheca rogersii]
MPARVATPRHRRTLLAALPSSSDLFFFFFFLFFFFFFRPLPVVLVLFLFVQSLKIDPKPANPPRSRPACSRTHAGCFSHIADRDVGCYGGMYERTNKRGRRAYMHTYIYMPYIHTHTTHTYTHIHIYIRSHIIPIYAYMYACVRMGYVDLAEEHVRSGKWAVCNIAEGP